MQSWFALLHSVYPRDVLVSHACWHIYSRRMGRGLTAPSGQCCCLLILNWGQGVVIGIMAACVVVSGVLGFLTHTKARADAGFEGGSKGAPVGSPTTPNAKFHEPACPRLWAPPAGRRYVQIHNNCSEVRSSLLCPPLNQVEAQGEIQVTTYPVHVMLSVVPLCLSGCALPLPSFSAGRRTR